MSMISVMTVMSVGQWLSAICLMSRVVAMIRTICDILGVRVVFHVLRAL
jgi:hypothetical protein